MTELILLYENRWSAATSTRHSCYGSGVWTNTADTITSIQIFSSSAVTGAVRVFKRAKFQIPVHYPDTTFSGLSDTPDTYEDGKYLRVTSSGIEAIDGIILKSQNGSEFLLTVTNSGILGTTPL